MRARRSLTGLAFAVLFMSGCVGPLATRPQPPTPGATDSSVPPSNALSMGSERSTHSPSARIATADCEEEDPTDVTGEGSPTDDANDAMHIDDGFESPLDPAAASDAATAAPFAELSDSQIVARLRSDIGALGPMSIGGPRGGVLVAGVQMPHGQNWEVVHPSLAWGTKETVEALSRAIDSVAARFPNTPRAFIGDLSGSRGGHLPPHVSHQSGRDVDVGYYLKEGHRWYAAANAANLDTPRTWALLRTLVVESDIDLILVDRQIQRVLKAHALEIGEDAAWLDAIFQVGGKSRRPLFFHAKGHATHFHVRFYSPVAQELGRRAYLHLATRRMVSLPTSYVVHTVKAGETLSHLALHYKLSVDAIKKANALRTDALRLGKQYKIPRSGGIARPARVVVPARRLPPTPNALAARKSTSRPPPCPRASTR